MNKIASVLICLLTLTGCSQTKELVVRNKPVEKPKLDIPLPAPVKMESLQWYVITDKNHQEVIEKVKDGNGVAFLVATDEQGYKNLAINNSYLLRYIREQKAVLAAYRKYYETADPEK